MRIGDVDTNDRVLVVAEIGNNHEGDYALAERMIFAAADAGVDAVKFQTIVPERLVSSLQTERIKQLQRFQLSYEEFGRLSKAAHDAGVLFISTPFDLESVRVLEGIVDAYKVSSGDNTFFPLIDRVCETGKPLIVSAGLTDLELIEKICNHIQNKWTSLSVNQQLAVLHCVCSYPVSDEDANLSAICKLRGLGVTVGYSDHTLGVDASVLSVAFGAKIVEKHFTLDKNYSTFRDHQLSADPTDMKELVLRIRKAEQQIGSGDKKIPTCEESLLLAARRSVVASKDLECGRQIEAGDLTWVRPGGGIPPGDESSITGKVLIRKVVSGEMILPEYIKG